MSGAELAAGPQSRALNAVNAVDVGTGRDNTPTIEIKLKGANVDLNTKRLPRRVVRRSKV